MSTCEYCNANFTTNQSLKRHYSRCKEKQKQYQEQLEKQLGQQQKHYQEQLGQQQKHYQEQLEKQQKQYKEQLEKQLEEQRVQKVQYETRIEKLEDKLFEIAKQPKTVTTNNTTQTNNSRNTSIINQLALYDLSQEQITQLLVQHFNLDTFHGGPEEIAKLAARFLLTDPETQKPKVACTDISRKNFRYVDEEQEVQVDPGFQKTHDLIKEPLSKANIRVYVDELHKDDKYHDQWRKNEDFISDRSGFSDKLIKWMV
jgi:hypothetical protein